MYSVLIAEDELLVRMGLTISVPWEQLGMYVVQDVASGQDAWEVYQCRKPDILITDLAMPDLDGLSLIRRIRQQDSHIAIVVVTCMERFELLHEAMELGVSAYLIKVRMTINDITQAVCKARDSIGAARGSRSGKLSPETKKELLCAYIVADDLSPEQFSSAALQQGWQLPQEIPAVFVRIREAGRMSEVSRRMLSHMCQEYLQACQPVCFSREGAQDVEIGMILETALQSNSAIEKLRNFSEYIGTHFPVLPRSAISSRKIALERLPFWFASAARITAREYLFEDSLLYIDEKGAVCTGELDALIERLRNQIFYLGGQSIAALNCLWHVQQAIGQEEAILQKELRALASFTTEESVPPLSEGLTAALRWIGNHLPQIPSRRKEILEIQRYLEHNLSEPLHLSQVADIVHVHPQYLSSLFKKELGIGYNDYLNMLRIDMAGRLLENESIGLQKISELCGFSDITYFCRKFKQKTGMTAIQWRKGQR